MKFRLMQDRLALLGELRSAQEGGRGRTNNKGLKKCGKILLAVISEFFLVDMIASLGVDLLQVDLS